MDYKSRYWPKQFEEMLEDDIPSTIINQPLCAAVPLTLLPTKPRSLHAVLCEALTNTQALLARLEAGVRVAEAGQRETVRELYVQTRHQREALIACLELPGLE
jgi:hypothetical protein